MPFNFRRIEMNLGSGIGWFIGMLIGIGFSVGGTVLLHFGQTMAFGWGLLCGIGCSMAGLIVGTELWDRRDA